MKQMLIAFFLVITVTGNTQSWQDTAALIDKIMSRYADSTPGAQLAISRNGQVIYSSVRGMANLEYNVPLTKLSKIEAGSVSKQFTAAAILLLELRGKLSIDDEVRKYVPEVPDYGYRMTIRHLMNHASGLRDWGSIAELTGWPRGTKAYTNEDALRIISLQKSLNNKPGDEYIYSNSNYTLLTTIVQRVSGMSHPAFTKENIFGPAGMTNTEWRDNYKRVVANRATAYSKSGNVYQTNMPNENAFGHGGLLTTAEDLLKWNDYYLNSKLGGPSLLTKQLTITALNNGKRNIYAAGLSVDSVNGWRSITHSGATASYRANLEHFPQLNLSIAWVSNNSQSDLSDIPYTVRNLVVKDNNPVRAPETKVSTVEPRSFNSYLGAYRENRTGAGIRLIWKDGGIHSLTNGGPLPVINENTLAAGRSKVVFLSARPRTLDFISAGGDTIRYVGVDTAVADPRSLSEYAGTYYSVESESAIRVFVKDGQLFVHQKPGAEAPITAIYKDGFYFPGGDIYFERDKNGKITHFYVSVSRARKVRFDIK